MNKLMVIVGCTTLMGVPFLGAAPARAVATASVDVPIPQNYLLHPAGRLSPSR